MPVNQSPDTLSRPLRVALRRRQVASLRLREGLSEAEIAQRMFEQGYNNKGKPWSQSTISSDLRAVHEDWQKRAAEDIGAHKQRIIAELGEVKAAAWLEKSYGDILRAIEKECKILGVDSPDRQIIIEGDLEAFLARLPEEYQNAIRKLIVADFVGGSGPAGS
jgi:hypothetical protein